MVRGNRLPVKPARCIALEESIVGVVCSSNAGGNTETVSRLTFFDCLARRLGTGFAEEFYWQTGNPLESKVIGHEERAPGQQRGSGMNGIGRF